MQTPPFLVSSPQPSSQNRISPCVCNHYCAFREQNYSNGRLPNHTKKGSFWCRNILKLLDKYKGLASVDAGDGLSCMLWDDCWTGPPLKLTYPELISFAKNHPFLSELLWTIMISPTSLISLCLWKLLLSFSMLRIYCKLSS